MKGYFHFINKYVIEADKDADLDYLSDTDVECLDYAINKCKGKTFGELTEMSHDLAWNNTLRDREMSVKDILRENGENEDYVEYVASKLEVENTFLIMDFPVDSIASQIKRGTILHSNMFENIGHGKFFCSHWRYGRIYSRFLFFINSNVHKSIFGKQEQLSMQYPLRHSDYGFLKYDSFLCASNIIKRHRNYIAHSIVNGETEFVGNLREEHLNDVLEMARCSRLFSKIDKKRFFY